MPDLVANWGICNWTVEDWSVFWAGVGALGQWVGAFATVWAVLVALKSVKREREGIRRALKLKHMEMAPDVAVRTVQRHFEEHVDEDFNLRTGRWDGITLSFSNEGLGDALRFRTSLNVTQGDLTPTKQVEYEILPAGHGDATCQFIWSGEAEEIIGHLLLEYEGRLGATYKKEYQLTVTVNDHDIKLLRQDSQYPTDVL